MVAIYDEHAWQTLSHPPQPYANWQRQWYALKPNQRDEFLAWMDAQAVDILVLKEFELDQAGDDETAAWTYTLKFRDRTTALRCKQKWHFVPEIELPANALPIVLSLTSYDLLCGMLSEAFDDALEFNDGVEEGDSAEVDGMTVEVAASHWHFGGQFLEEWWSYAMSFKLNSGTLTVNARGPGFREFYLHPNAYYLGNDPKEVNDWLMMHRLSTI